MTPPSVANRSKSSCKNGVGVRLRLRCAYVPSASQWEVIAALRKLQLGKSAPFQRPRNAIYRYRVQEKGIHALQVPDNEEKRRPYVVGDIIWIKPPGSRCTTKFKHERVTGVVSHHSIEVNGVPCHIKDLRPFQGPILPSESETDCENQSAEGGILITLGPTPLDTTKTEADDSVATSSQT